LADFASKSDSTVIRILSLAGKQVAEAPAGAPPLGPPQATPRTIRGYRVVSVPILVRLANGDPIGRAVLQYGGRVSATEKTVRRVELFLLLGVLAGSGLALLAGM